MSEENTQSTQTKEGDSIKELETEQTLLESQVKSLRRDLALACMELADLRKRKIELERAAEKIITEETKETVATEVESLMDDGSSESKSADSDYEVDDIQGSEDSKDDRDIQYERPVTRSTARESDAESAASGIITRSKDSKLSKEVEEPPPRPAESPVKAPRPAQEPPKIETPIIPSALPLIMHNPDRKSVV